MTPDVALWILGAALSPVFVWGVHLTITTKQTKGDTKKLVRMHESPDDYGFGSGKISEAQDKMTAALESNTVVMKDLTHYLKWLAEHTTGQEPPPPV